jgi:hypothetical protein
MIEAQPTAREASLLMGATMAASMAGIFLGIFFLFISTDTAARVAAAVLVGVVGFLSFLRHSIYFVSDQIRMGWRQDRPEFQLEVGYANLAVGIWAIIAAASGWVLVCGILLATYGTYLLCALLLHVSQAFARQDQGSPELRARAVRSSISTGFFVLALYGFAVLALAREGVLPFLHP